MRNRPAPKLRDLAPARQAAIGELLNTIHLLLSSKAKEVDPRTIAGLLTLRLERLARGTGGLARATQGDLAGFLTVAKVIHENELQQKASRRRRRDANHAR